VKSLHICYISQEYPPETGWGGIGSYTHEMAHALAGKGHRVTVVSRAVGAPSVTEHEGVAVHRVAPGPDWDSVPALWRLNRVWPGFAWAAMKQIRKIHRATPIDIVEAAEGRGDSFFTGLIPGGPKVLVRLHTARIFIDRLNKVPALAGGRREYWLEKRAIAQASVLTAPSQAVIDLTKTWVSIDSKKTFVVPNPIDSEKFSPSNSPRRNLVLFVGRLERNKGVETIAAALPLILEKFPAAEFCFLGRDSIDHDGASWRHKLNSAVGAKHQSHLRFEQVSREQLPDFYRQAAVCMLPSVWENCPYAALEAMACATPLVATNGGGIPEIVENGVSGFLLQSGDARGFAARIVSLLEDAALRASIGEGARARVAEAFSVERVLPKMIAVYESAAHPQRQHVLRADELPLPSQSR
jgi:glycosyltransferase involved in cell wall biosynthesis